MQAAEADSGAHADNLALPSPKAEGFALQRFTGSPEDLLAVPVQPARRGVVPEFTCATAPVPAAPAEPAAACAAPRGRRSRPAASRRGR